MLLDEYPSSSAVYGLTTKARCIAAQIGDPDNVRFLVGTLCLKEDENEVHLIEVNEIDNEVKCLYIYNHHVGEIWHLSPSPSDPNLFFTCYNTNINTTPQFKATLWKTGDDNLNLVPLTELKGHVGDIKSVIWNPAETENSESVISIDTNNVRYWKIENGGSTTKQISSGNVGELHNMTAACWNPIHPELIATANDSQVKGWDLRSMKETFNITQAHMPFVRDLDYNPYRDYMLVTGGDDYKIKFWDVRKTDMPVMSLPGHSHWVWNVKYNPYHDHLVLSCSTDCMVNLWNIVSISSESDEQDPNSPKSRDHLIKTYEEHEDSVYSVAWGNSGWSFASLSYDGRVVINEVPKEYTDFYD